MLFRSTSIALQRERREGILSSIDTMSKVYASFKKEGQPEQTAEAPEQLMGGLEQMQPPM